MLAGAGSGQVMPRAPDTRGGALDTYMPATTAPGPPARQRHHAGRAPHVDYSQVLPQIVDMQRFYAQRQDTQDIAERLNELEYLMRSGTPTAGSRSRLNQLAGRAELDPRRLSRRRADLPPGRAAGGLLTLARGRKGEDP